MRLRLSAKWTMRYLGGEKHNCWPEMDEAITKAGTPSLRKQQHEERGWKRAMHRIGKLRAWQTRKKKGGFGSQTHGEGTLTSNIKQRRQASEDLLASNEIMKGRIETPGIVRKGPEGFAGILGFKGKRYNYYLFEVESVKSTGIAWT
jgi:hypothetical protein